MVLKGGPTVSTFTFSGILQLTTGEASVRPYPCNVGNPIAFKNSPILLSSAPPPETNAWSFPPNWFLIFFLTNFSHKKLKSFSLKVSLFLFKIFTPKSKVLLISFFLKPFCF